MAQLEKIVQVAVPAMVSMECGYLSFSRLSEQAIALKIFLLAELAHAPELTTEMYRVAARAAAEKTPSEYLITGVLLAAMGGISAGIALYQACKKE